MLIRKCAFCILLAFIPVANAVGQAPADDENKAVVIPRTNVLPVVVYQPDCPLRLEDYNFIDLVAGGAGNANYQFRNISAKPIQSLIIAWLTSVRTGVEFSFAAKTPAERIKPGETLPDSESDVVLVPLTDEIRKKKKLEGPMEGIICLMVVRVEFDDGTVYSDEPAYKALQAYWKIVNTGPHVKPGAK